MKPLRISTRMPLAFAITFTSFCGCQKNAPLAPSAAFEGAGAQGKVTLPPLSTETQGKVPLPPLPTGMVRLSGQKIQEDGKTVHWKWTILGDRTWHGYEGDTYSARLYDSSPLTASGQAGGANAYAYEVTLSATDSEQGGTDLHYATSLHSANVDGGSVIGSGLLKRNMKRIPVIRSVKVLIKGEKILPLPFDQPVLEVTGQEENGKKFHEVFHIKIAK